jgi:hypothetical protein
MGHSETIRSLVEDPDVQAVELKITAREEQEERRVCFFDTPGLAPVGAGSWCAPGSSRPTPTTRP